MMSNALDEDIVIINDSIDDIFVTALTHQTSHLVKRRDTDSCFFFFFFENIRSLRRMYSGLYLFECEWPYTGWPSI